MEMMTSSMQSFPVICRKSKKTTGLSMFPYFITSRRLLINIPFKRYEEDEDAIADGLFESVRERAKMPEPAHSGSPPISLPRSQPALPSPQPPSSTASLPSAGRTSDNSTPYGGLQNYSRHAISFREDEDDEDDEEDDDVIEIKTPSRRSSSSSLNSAGKLSPTVAKYPLPADSSLQSSQLRQDASTPSRTVESPSHSPDSSFKSPSVHQPDFLTGNDGIDAPLESADQSTSRRAPVARKMKSRRGGYTSGSGSGSNSGSGSRSRSANGPRYAGYTQGYSTYGYPGLYPGVVSIGPSEHMTIAPIAPTVLKAGGRSGSGDGDDEGDDDEEREVQELSRELEKLGEEGNRSGGGVFYVGGGYPYGPSLATSLYGRYGGGNGYGGGTYGFDGYGSYHLDENDEEIGQEGSGQEDKNINLMPTVLSRPLVRSPSPLLDLGRDESSPNARSGGSGDFPRARAERSSASKILENREEERHSPLLSSSVEPKENPRIASLKSGEAFFHPQQQKERESSPSVSPTSSPVTSASGSATPVSPQSSPATSWNSSSGYGSKSREEDSLAPPPPTLAIPTPAVSSSHIRYTHADGFSDSHARRFLTPPDASSLSPSSRTSPPTSYSSSDNPESGASASSPRGRSLTRSQRSGGLGGSNGSADPEQERGRSRSRSTATSITSGANSPTLSDSGGSCYHTSSSPSARRQSGILGIGNSYGPGVYGGIGGVAPRGGREVRDARGVRLYRKTSEDQISSSAGSSMDRDVERGRVSYGRVGNGKNLRPARGSESLSPVGEAYAASSLPSSLLRQDVEGYGGSRSLKRVGSRDGPIYQSYSVNSFGTGGHPQDEGLSKRCLPVVEESADEKQVTLVDITSDKPSESFIRKSNDHVQSQVRNAPLVVQSARPRPSPSVSSVDPTSCPPSDSRQTTEPQISVTDAHGTIVGKAADLLSTTRGILGVFWSS
ncbi:hypothetical protein SCHPADRAFT_467611 [Schizopora paradoxa]|uniref:Uncharacterized protein n=1 Tax=Schizopora paradoxa TaxID=27342 RepID=A0A0H2RPZ0_9AGAM|nr:hypothetical protein SCHPADRAFT_467611 [Schizopora paradoxa]